MTATIWHFTMSLDGFLADERGDVAPVMAGSAPARIGMELVPRLGAVLLGRGTHDGYHDELAPSRPYGGAFTGPLFVLTSRRPATPIDGLEYLTDGLGPALDTARAAAGPLDVVLLGARLGQSCLREGLVDEVLVHVSPVVLGRGIRAFADGDPRRVLEVVQRSEADEMTTLRMVP